MEERRLGPVVGLGTWNTFGDDATLASEGNASALGASTSNRSTISCRGGSTSNG
jgi:hypothetical protein